MHAHQPIQEDHRAQKDDAKESDSSANSRNEGLRVVADNTAGRQSGLAKIDHRTLLIERQALTIKLISEFLDQPSIESSLTALALELQHKFRCDRVVVGIQTDTAMTVQAISQQAAVDIQSSEAKLLTAALTEACDQDVTIQYPTDEDSLNITLAHKEIANGRTNANFCTIPLCHDGKIIGALLFDLESSQGWSKLTISFMEQIADIISPLIFLRQNAEQGIINHVKHKVQSYTGSILKPTHLVNKALALLVVLLLAVAYLLPVTHQVTTTAEIVPEVKRVIASPLRGYLQTAYFKNGDKVQAGDILVKLDTRDLELERVKRQNDLSSAKTELRASMAGHNRKDMAIAQARLDQALAKIDLINKQISRATLRAPVEGLIINGDLQQSLGAPVERGDTLLEMSPTTGHKAYLLVAESEVDHIQVGQKGKLKLKSDPANDINISVNEIHPIAIGSDGRNRFRIEAEIASLENNIKPGLTGVAKIEVGETKLLWALTYKFSNWARLQLWEWFG